MPFCRWWLTGHPARGATTHLRLARGWRWRFWPAPWVCPGEGRFSSLLRPRFKSHRDHPKHPPRPGRPAVCRVVRRVPIRGVARSRRRGERELAARAEWETGQEQQEIARSEALESARRSGSTSTRQHAARALGEFTAAFAARGGRSAVVLASFRPSLHAQSSLAPPRAGEAFRITSAERGLGLAERRAARTPHAPRRASHDHPRAERPSRVTTRPKRRCEAEEGGGSQRARSEERRTNEKRSDNGTCDPPARLRRREPPATRPNDTTIRFEMACFAGLRHGPNDGDRPRVHDQHEGGTLNITRPTIAVLVLIHRSTPITQDQ